MIIISGAVLALLIFSSVICAVIYVIRRSKNNIIFITIRQLLVFE